MLGGGEHAHVQADFGDDRVRDLGADAGDLVQAGHDGQRRRLVWLIVCRWGVGVFDSGDRGLNGGRELGDLSLDEVVLL